MFKVLTHIIEQYLACAGYQEGELWIRIDHSFIIKQLGLKQREYYSLIAQLKKQGFIENKKIQGKLFWRPLAEGLYGLQNSSGIQESI